MGHYNTELWYHEPVNFTNFDPAALVMSLAALLLSLSLHESARAWVADYLGDYTARRLGRVSLNPLVGYATGMPVFGWAKPVPVNPLNLKNPKTDHLFIAAAGPASNIIAAAASLLGLKLITVLFAFQLATGHAVISPLSLFFYTSLMINVVLAVFNLIPIPPLDGSWILSGLLSDRFSALMDSIRPYSFVLLILLLFSGVLGMVFHPILSFARQLAL